MRESLCFSDIYNEFYHKILQYLKRLIGDQEAEEMAQIVFEKISRNLNTFQGTSRLSTWIYKVATNATLDRLKSQSYKYSQSGPLAPFPIHKPEIENTFYENTSTPIPPDKKIIRDEMNECIREFIDKLPPDYKTIITLNEIKGFTNSEIAEILQISLNTAKIRLHRARTKLRQILVEGCDFYHNELNELACDRKQSINQS